MTQITANISGSDAVSSKGIEIGKKLVFLSRPYQPQHVAELVGREDEMKMVTAAWLAGPNHLPLSPLLLGEPGVGKNHMVYELARKTERELYIFQGHEDVTAEDLACSVRFSDVEGRRMDYVASQLVTAMHTGGICFIDEIAKIRPRALALLVSVLDERRYIDSTLLGERVVAKPGFRFIAATNTADLDGNALPEFIRSRMRPVINIRYPERAEIDRIIQNRHRAINDQLGQLLDAFWNLWEESNIGRPPSPRDAIHAFDLAVSLADYERLDRLESKLLTKESSGGPVSPKALEMAFNELFQQSGAAL